MHRAATAFSRLWGWLWSTLTRKRSPAATKVIIHDPSASRPHDLDDPFFDPKIQSRFAEMIARAVRSKDTG
jgi:hypothetical protein